MKNYFKIIMPAVALLFFLTGCNLQTGTTLYPIEQNNKIGFIDRSGKEVIEAKYDDAISNNKECLVAVKFNGLWGFIDKKGTFVIVPQYKETTGFYDGLAYVTDEKYEGYIDTKGTYVWKQAIPKKEETKPQQAAAPAKAARPIKNDFADSILDEFGL